MKILAFLLSTMLFIACDPPSAFMECNFEYPINAIGLKDTIKTTDTIWIVNDFDAKLCLANGTYNNGKGEESPYFFKLVNDSFEWYEPILIGFSDSIRNQDNWLFYKINFNYSDGRYKSKYCIVFPEPGIYSLSMFGGLLQNGKDSSIGLTGYFNCKSNNMNLFPSSVKMPDWEIGKSSKYLVYFIEVVE
jgi:hypothetical protein